MNLNLSFCRDNPIVQSNTFDGDHDDCHDGDNDDHDHDGNDNDDDDADNNDNMNLNLSFWRDDPIVRRIETNISGFPSSATAPPGIMEMIKRGNNGDEDWTRTRRRRRSRRTRRRRGR